MFIISKDCAGCSNCIMECPVHAINYVGTKNEIDQSKCIGCGRCANVCHTGACYDTEALSVPKHEPVHIKADVVVCGAGTGLIAAVRAAQEGKKVIVLEKNKECGGNTDFATLFVTPYCKWFKELGMEDNREAAVEHYLNACGHQLREDCVRTAVYKSCEFFDWLCDNADCESFFQIIDASPSDGAGGPMLGDFLVGRYLNFMKNVRCRDNLNCRDESFGPGKTGTFVKYACLDTIERDKLDVTIYTSTAAKHLMTDDEGKISGVIAEDGGGQLIIDAPAVVLSTGGFGHSDEKLQKYFNFFDQEVPVVRFSVRTNTGDAWDMIEELGVKPDTERILLSGHGPKHHPFSNVLSEIALSPMAFLLNAEGRRWVNEMTHLFVLGRLVDSQPKRIGWTIGNYDYFAEIAEDLIQHPFIMTSNPDNFKTWYYELEEEALCDTPVKKADTLEELAVMCGMDPDVLMETIYHYNEMCEKGEDTDFGKPAQFLRPLATDKGPYYAIYGQKFSETAIGGVRVNGNCEVLHEDYKTIIPGLYASGDTTSAMMQNNEYSPITELTWATASAFACGENASAYVDSLRK